MNKVYKRVFSRSLGQFVVASENAKGKSKTKTHKTGSNVVKTLTALTFAISALSASMANAVVPNYIGDAAKVNSYLPNTTINYSNYYSADHIGTYNFWENPANNKDNSETINVSDLLFVPPYSWYTAGFLYGDRNVAFGTQSANYGSYDYVDVHGANNTALITGDSYATIQGNNNTIIGVAAGLDDSSHTSSYINALLNKNDAYGSMDYSSYNTISTQNALKYIDELKAAGYTDDDITKLGIEKYVYDNGEVVVNLYNKQSYDPFNSFNALTSNVGHNNNVFGDGSVAQGNNNTLIGDNQYSGGNNNILASGGATVTSGSNNVVAGAYTNIMKGSNNVVIASKDAERSKYKFQSGNEEVILTRMSLDVVEGINPGTETMWDNSNFSGNFERDYYSLKNRYLTQGSEANYYQGILQGGDLEYFLKKRDELFAYYGYAIGESQNSILIGTSGKFSADNGIAIGQNASAVGLNSIAIGANSNALEDNTIAGGFRKLTSIQDGATDKDLINVKQAKAWSEMMLASLNKHVEFVDTLQPNGSRYPKIKDVTAQEVIDIIDPDLKLGTESVRTNLIDTKLTDEVKRAEAEILTALNIKKNEEVADAKINIILDIGENGSISSKLNEAILGYGTVESDLNKIINNKAEELVALGAVELDESTAKELQSNADVITDMFTPNTENLDLMAIAGFDVNASKDAAKADDELHTAEINNLISSTITGKASDGSTVIVDSLSKEDQDVIAADVKQKSDDLNKVVVENFENYQTNSIGKYKEDLGSKLDKGINDAISNIDNLAKIEDQAMLNDVGNIADEADKKWAQQALDTSKSQVEDISNEILDYASKLDEQLVIDANKHVDESDLAMLDQGIKDLTAKDNAVKEELTQAIKDGDQLVADTAKSLAEDLDKDLQADMISYSNTTNEQLLTGLQTFADAGDQVLFDRFDEFLKSAESADVNRINAEITDGDAETYRQLVDYADQGDYDTLMQAQSYIDQKYGELKESMQKSEEKLNASVASSLATASVPTSNRAGKALVGFGTGYYGGQSALALGASALTSSKKFSFGLTVSLDTQHDNSGSFSIGYYWK